jgi:hypothetical protein
VTEELKECQLLENSSEFAENVERDLTHQMTAV